LIYLKNYKGWLFESFEEKIRILDDMSKRKDWQDRLIAADNLDSTEEIFNRLSRDPLSAIRSAVANNPKASPSALKYLYYNRGDKLEIQNNWRITRYAILNPNMPIDVLRDITESALDDHPTTASSIDGGPTGPHLEWALENPNMPTDLLNDIIQRGPGPLKKKVARHPNASEDILLSLSDDPVPLIRIAIIKNPNVSPEILSKLSRDTNFVVRAEIASLSNAPIETLVALKHDENEEVRERAFNTLQYLVSSDRSLENKIEELEALLDLGIRSDVNTLNLDELDI
jgi:hypothetical protein